MAFIPLLFQWMSLCLYFKELAPRTHMLIMLHCQTSIKCSIQAGILLYKKCFKDLLFSVFFDILFPVFDNIHSKRYEVTLLF